MRTGLILILLCFLNLAAHAQEIEPPSIDISDLPDHVEMPNEVAKSGQLGVGAQVGIQSGLNAEYWLSEGRTITGGVTVEHGNTVVNVAYLWMFRGAFPDDIDPLVPFAGVGAMGVFGNKRDILNRTDETFLAAAQIPLGFEFISKRQYSFFAEVSFGVVANHAAQDFITADVGARYYFF